MVAQKNMRGLKVLKAIVRQHGSKKIALAINLTDTYSIKKWIKAGHIPFKWSDPILNLKEKGIK